MIDRCTGRCRDVIHFYTPNPDPPEAENWRLKIEDWRFVASLRSVFSIKIGRSTQSFDPVVRSWGSRREALDGQNTFNRQFSIINCQFFEEVTGAVFHYCWHDTTIGRWVSIFLHNLVQPSRPMIISESIVNDQPNPDKPEPKKMTIDEWRLTNEGIASLRLFYKSLMPAVWEARNQNNEMTP